MVGRAPQIRNIGHHRRQTPATAWTSADSASTLHAWEAIIEPDRARTGFRRIPIKEFLHQGGHGGYPPR